METVRVPQMNFQADSTLNMIEMVREGVAIGGGVQTWSLSLMSQSTPRPQQMIAVMLTRWPRRPRARPRPRDRGRQQQNQDILGRVAEQGRQEPGHDAGTVVTVETLAEEFLQRRC